ncbi:MAG: L,D-transpeptidase [Marmoricola sp.]
MQPVTRRPRLAVLALAASAALAVSGCSASKVLQTSADGASSPSATQPAKPIAKIHLNVAPGATAVKVDRVVTVKVKHGDLQSVRLAGPGGQVAGKMAGNAGIWKATGLLRPDSRYSVVVRAVDDNGLRQKVKRTFHTQKLTLDQQTYPSFVPTAGQTVGIAMPVIIRFDVPVTDKAAIEKHLHVTSQPAQVGAFHWISDNEVHWRPEHYWKGGTTVTVKADIGGVPAGNGIYGQLDREETFHIGRAQVDRVNIDTDQLTVVRDGRTIRTIPVTTGAQPKYTTRSGIKVIAEKHRRYNMNSETIGIDPNSADGYDLKGVEYAMRLTYSGEFLHAAPWSVASQGHANVSHGCTGMSTANAGWLYHNSLIGDPVEFTGSNRPMTLTNGYGDWNESFTAYKQGSAL